MKGVARVVGSPIIFLLGEGHLGMRTSLLSMLVWGAVTVAMAFAWIPSALAQRRVTGLISPPDARRYGLNVRWVTTVQVNPSVARVAGMKMHVDSKRAHTYFEVIADGARTVFSERRLDAYGEPLGVEGAKKAAEEYGELLKSRGAKEVEVQQRVVAHMVLYVLTDAALLQAIDAETGKTLWRAEVGDPREVSIGPAVSDDFVAIINGLKLRIFDAESGRRLWTKTLDNVPIVSPLIVDRVVFVPTASGRVVSYLIDNPMKDRPHLPSFGRIYTPATRMGSRMIWSTNEGYLNIASAISKNVEYYIETDDVVANSPVFVPPNTVLYATKHGTLYSMDPSPPRIRWRYPTGDWTHQQPIPIGGRVYYITDILGLHAIDLKTGKALWNTRQIGRFVAATDRHVYVLDRAKRMVVLNAENGNRLAVFHTEELDLTFTNIYTDRIFIGTKRGLLQCVHEIANEWPVMHWGGEETAESEQAAQGDKAAKPAEQPKEPADPFAAPADEDPFGAPMKKDDGADDDPFGAPKKDDDNPFGN